MRKRGRERENRGEREGGGKERNVLVRIKRSTHLPQVNISNLKKNSDLKKKVMMKERERERERERQRERGGGEGRREGEE